MTDPGGLQAAQTYRNLKEGFDRAREACPRALTESWYTFAGRGVRIRVVGRRLAAVVDRPFAHLRRMAPERETALRIDLWDKEETGVACDGCPPLAAGAQHGQIAASPDGRFVLHARRRTQTVLDRASSHLVGWSSSARELSQFETGRPLHAQLLLWHQDRGVQAVHAGLVAGDEGGVLLGGPGGSGKTTTALACWGAGYAYLADDYVGLEDRGDGGFVGHSLFASSHVDPEHLRRFPTLTPHPTPARLPEEEKSLVLLSPGGTGRLGTQAPIQVIALPVFRGTERTTWRPASKVEALLRLAPSSLLMLPHGGTTTGFRMLSGLVEAVSTFWIELGTDLEEIPDRIGEILRAANRAG